MIIKQIKFCDFLVFPGEQFMEFPTDGESNLVLILAPNNSGKTSVIRGLRFLFSGHLPGITSSERLHELIHDGTKSATAIGREATAWVEITIRQDEEDFCVRRTVSARKVSEKVWRTGQSQLYRVFHGNRTTLNADDKGMWQKKLWTLVPEHLFDAFYFKGEPLDGKLLGGVGQIRESLASFLHEDRWDEVEEALEEAEEEYTRQLGTLMAKHSEYKKLLEEEERLQKFLRTQEQQVEKHKSALASAVDEFRKTDEALHEIGQASDTAEIIEQLRKARRDLESASRAFEQIDSEIARLVGNSRGLPFLSASIPKVRTVLATMQRQNLLPADVSEGFVDRVLKANQCICGRKHDEDSRLHWEEYKRRSLSVDLNHGLCDLLNSVQENAPHGYVATNKELHDKLPALREQRTNCLKKINELDALVKELQKRVERSPLPDIQSLSLKLRTLATERQRHQQEVTEYENGLAKSRASLKELRHGLEKAKPRGTSSARVQAIEQARQHTTRLLELVTQSRRVLGEAFSHALQRSVTEYYDRAVYDNSKARIHRDTLLPAIEVNGQVHHNLGGGQSQLLALAYVVSLARLRKQLHEEMQALGISFGSVYDQSFFLDSPFNHVSENAPEACHVNFAA